MNIALMSLRTFEPISLGNDNIFFCVSQSCSRFATKIRHLCCLIIEQLFNLTAKDVSS